MIRITPIQELLKIFDGIRDLGWVESRRSGPTGVGYTFESLMGICENNSPDGDFRGIEIKTFRSTTPISAVRTLLGMEPQWVDGLRASERILRYGYWSAADQRQALYTTVRTPPHTGLGLAVIDGSHIELRFNHELVGWWDREKINARLQRKLTETVFIGARADSTNGERFHYHSLTHYAQPDVDRLFDLIRQNTMIVDFRMHRTPTGSARNHGTAFRIAENQLGGLFHTHNRLR